ncbi:MAG: hypothetical protein ABI868_11440 [Acidobacteriota bacterium]
MMPEMRSAECRVLNGMPIAECWVLNEERHATVHSAIRLHSAIREQSAIRILQSAIS